MAEPMSTFPTVKTPLLTAKEACSYLKIGRNTLDRMVREGEVRALKVGGSLRFDEVDLLAACRVHPRSVNLGVTAPVPPVA